MPMPRSARSRSEDFDITEERRLIEFTPAEKSEEIPENMGTQVAYFSDTGDCPGDQGDR